MCSQEKDYPYARAVRYIARQQLAMPYLSLKSRVGVALPLLSGDQIAKHLVKFKV